VNFNINQIVSAEELSLDIELLKKKLDICPELIVFKDNQPQFVISSLNIASDTIEKTKSQIANKKTKPRNNISDKDKIGKIAQETMRKIFYQNILPKEELTNLTDEKYSLDTFNLNFPVLKLYNPMVSFDEQKRDSKGYNRYYSFTLSAYGKQYLLCSQWIESLHRQKFEQWLKQWL
jgi:hypothetical protein